eukprot:8100660-Ditylum_brightwellii.AAC.1
MESDILAPEFHGEGHRLFWPFWMVHETVPCILLPPPELSVEFPEVGLHSCIGGEGGAAVDPGADG